jgi:preprotein translocase subunit SecG
MEEVVLVIHLMLAIAVTILVLLQRSEGGGLGIGGGGLGALATANTTASMLSRATAICVTGFFITSLVLGILSGAQHRTSLIDQLGAAPATAEKALPSDAKIPVQTPPEVKKPASPATPVTTPSVPVAK